MRKFLSKVALAAASLACFTGAANAFVVLSISDGTTTVTCNSGSGTGCAGFTFSANSISYTNNAFGTVGGGYAISVSTTTGNVPGDPDLGRLTNSVDGIRNNTGASGTLTITATGYGYTNPTSLGKTLFGRGAYTITQNGVGVDSVTGTYSAGNSLTDPALSPDSATFNQIAGASTSCSLIFAGTNSTPCDTSTVNFVDADGGFYSLRDQQVFGLSANSRVSSTTSANAEIPEPTTTALVGAALLALGATTRRRNAKRA